MKSYYSTGEVTYGRNSVGYRVTHEGGLNEQSEDAEAALA
jgi:hypothetical protein